MADTVTDTLPETLELATASGLVFNEANAGALLEAIKRALILYNIPSAWKKIQQTAMSKDFSWQRSAEQYLALYKKL